MLRIYSPLTLKQNKLEHLSLFNSGYLEPNSVKFGIKKFNIKLQHKKNFFIFNVVRRYVCFIQYHSIILNIKLLLCGIDVCIVLRYNIKHPCKFYIVLGFNIKHFCSNGQIAQSCNQSSVQNGAGQTSAFIANIKQYCLEQTPYVILPFVTNDYRSFIISTIFDVLKLFSSLLTLRQISQRVYPSVF